VDPDQLPPVPVPPAQKLEPERTTEEFDATSLAVTVRPGPRVPMAGQLAPVSAQRKPAAAREPAFAEAVRAEPARASAGNGRAEGEPLALRRREAAVAVESSAWEHATDTLTGARSPRDGLDEFDSHAVGEGGRGNKLMLILGLAAIALAVAYFLLGRDQTQQALGIDQPKPTAANDAAPAASTATPTTGERYGTLTVNSTPARAQVLMLVGSGPALIQDLPVGVAHEFVAMADGLAPARGLVPPGASWAPEGGSPRYELAVQLADAVGGVELGPSRMPQAVGTPTGALGSVRVVTSPPGARVYQLIGFTPDVRVENLPTAVPVELLLYLSGHALQRASVGPGDWKPQAGKLAASVNVTLTRKGR
jgi:hypothetical protein